ncbi:XdhC family protein [Actinokineospora guangxiensis]|uniref:XdhC family protein n=1 Tax=Actinokineospora guangxiensis TaxID=1490288 RepID=A0ABW0EQN7_9PSEU
MTDPSCAVAHGAATEDTSRALVIVFASAVGDHLLRYAPDLGYDPVLVDPQPARASVRALETIPELDERAAVVLTDHHRAELGPLLRDALATPAGWIGLMGNPRHPGPHLTALRSLGVAEPEIARVRRPIGLNIGSRTPAEIAVATLAGLIAERNGRPGGFEF